MIRKLNIQSGMNILVTAATSNTSLMAIEALKKYNINLFVSTTKKEFNEKLRFLGAKEVIVSGSDESEQFKHLVKKHGAFHAVIDPFFDLYLMKVIPFMRFNSHYITCGLYKQSSDFRSENLQYVDYSEIMKLCVLKNISLIGNCLGERNDLENALRDFVNNKFNVIIDSTYSKDDILPFIERTFISKDRFGKVVYSYV